MLIDGLILLANNVPLLKRMHEIEVETILPLVRLPQTPEFEDTNLRVEVIKQQLETAETAEEVPDSESSDDDKELPLPADPAEEMPKLED